MNHKNAVSVLPVPVGAAISAVSPRAMAGQPSACTRVGWPTQLSNHWAVCGPKSESALSMGL